MWCSRRREGLRRHWSLEPRRRWRPSAYSLRKKMPSRVAEWMKTCPFRPFTKNSTGPATRDSVRRRMGTPWSSSRETPEQVLYAGIMEALGYSANRRPFAALAASVPMARLRMLRGEPGETRAFGDTRDAGLGIRPADLGPAVGRGEVSRRSQWPSVGRKNRRAVEGFSSKTVQSSAATHRRGSGSDRPCPEGGIGIRLREDGTTRNPPTGH